MRYVWLAVLLLAVGLALAMLTARPGPSPVRLPPAAPTSDDMGGMDMPMPTPTH